MVSAEFVDPPQSEAELIRRALALRGETLASLAAQYAVAVPDELRRAKGWVGGLLERALGATAKSRAVPDFVDLGIELKSLPIDASGKPLESTFVCTVEMSEIADTEWEESRLYHKLRRVLWVPVEGTRALAVGERRIATPFLWSPSLAEDASLRADFQELALLMSTGRTGEITGHLGQVVQVRPKAARGSSRRNALDGDGAIYREQPKGFYLRPSFTKQIIAGHFGL